MYWNILVGGVSQTVIKADSEGETLTLFRKKTKGTLWVQEIVAKPMPEGWKPEPSRGAGIPSRRYRVGAMLWPRL